MGIVLTTLLILHWSGGSTAENGANGSEMLVGLQEAGGQVILNRFDKESGKLVSEVHFSGTQTRDEHLLLLKPLKNIAILSLVSCPGITDSGLERIKGIRTLQHLNLSGTRITDKGLKELNDLHNLRYLELESTEVTDAGLNELRGLKNLRFLNLARTDISGAGLISIKGLKNLQAINLNGCQRMNDEEFQALAEFRQLAFASLSCTAITDAGLKELKLREFKRLTILDLSQTKITDSSLAELKGIKSLVRLDLAKTNVTDLGLRELMGLTNLRTLNLIGCANVTDAGLIELHKSMKTTQIEN